MAAFTATSRVPTRPLSYAYKDMAYRKELMIDYTNGMIYVVDENGNIIDISQTVYETLVDRGDVNNGDSINVSVPNPNNPDEMIEITIQESITNILADIDTINSNIEKIQKIVDELSAGMDDGSGDITIDASKIVTDATHRFITDTQLSSMSSKVSITEKIVTINPTNISGSAAPYTCTVSCAGLNPDYPSPLLDISYSNDLYATNEEEEDAFYCIQRCKISTANEATIYFREIPSISFNIRFQIYTPGL